jgi:hypothetical protein
LRHARTNFLATAAGFALMLFALANSLVTLASGDYTGALLTALGCAFLALGCLAVPFIRGPLEWRLLATVTALPALFVFADFARRAPYVFGGG